MAAALLGTHSKQPRQQQLLQPSGCWHLMPQPAAASRHRHEISESRSDLSLHSLAHSLPHAHAGGWLVCTQAYRLHTIALLCKNWALGSSRVAATVSCPSAPPPQLRGSPWASHPAHPCCCPAVPTQSWPCSTPSHCWLRTAAGPAAMHAAAVSTAAVPCCAAAADWGAQQRLQHSTEHTKEAIHHNQSC